MSGISTGVGLVSGINTADLIDQLMQLEARPVKMLQNRATKIETQKASWMAINSGLMSAESSIQTLANKSTYQTNKTSTTDKAILTASAGTAASPGSYQFTVRRLAQAHQSISAGFTAIDDLVGAGAITVDLGAGKLNASTKLNMLNGAGGVGRGSISITNRAGGSATIDLSDAMTVDDVLEAINNEASLQVRASVSADGSGLTLTDLSGGAGSLSVAEVSGGSTAADLGLLGSAAADELVGSDINSIAGDTLLKNLNDGAGVRRFPSANDIVITRGDGTELKINLDDMTSVGDVLDAINNHADNADGLLTAAVSADGDGLTVTDTSGGAALVIADGAGSSAATDLGIAGTFAGGVAEGDALIAALNSTLLRSLDGGAGVMLGTLELQDRSGGADTVDLTGAASLHEVVERINAAATNITAAVSENGLGLTLTDASAGPFTHNMVVMDGGGGDFADKLGLTIDAAVEQVVGAHANKQYISEATELADLNQGEGVAQGKFTITAGTGASATINIGSSVETIDQVIRTINGQAASIGVSAQINDTGTGIVLLDASGGGGRLKVSENGGTTAADLGLEGQAETGEAFLDGSFRRRIVVEADETLEELVDRINDSNLGFTAGIINDGGGSRPYRLILTSETTGAASEMAIDTGATGLSMSTFVEGRDALMRLGAAGSANSFLVSSNSNEFDDVISGVTMTAHGVSDNPVTLTIERDVQGIVKKVQSFVESFNGIVKNIDELNFYDPETRERGALFGDAMLSNVRSRLMNMILQPANTSDGRAYFSRLGLTLGAGNTLEFDADKFTAAFKANPSQVVDMLAEATAYEDDEGVAIRDDYGREKLRYAGLATGVERILEDMTRSYDGLLAQKNNSLDSQAEVIKDRIESLNDRLSAKRAQLERQFVAMEKALAQMQGQQSALAGLASQAASFSSMAKVSNASSG